MSDLPNRELVVYVLSLLGGESRRVHTEDIAAKCHELFPAAFSWTKYTHFPDKDIVRVALIDARKARWGALVDGRTGEGRGLAAKTKRNPLPDGWMLTENGVKWLRDNTERLQALGPEPMVKAHRQKLLKELARVRSHPLFSRFAADGNAFAASIGEIADFLRCRVDASRDVWGSRFEVLRGKATVADQKDVVAFLQACENVYLASH